MTLLEDIQNAAVDGTTDLATLLRKCKLLASRSGSQSLSDWVIWESNGYPDNSAVPGYRTWPLEVKGHFSGPFQSGIRNAPIPNACLPERARKHYSKYECRQSVASVEEALRTNKDGLVRVSTADLALHIGTSVYRNMNCVHAWAEFPIGILTELVNSVRNRILDLSLALAKELPNLGETISQNPSGPQSERITQIFNTTVYGGSANIVGMAWQSTIEFKIVAQDFSSLEGLLLENMVSSDDVKDLHAAIEADPPPVEPERFGPKVSDWIAKMMGKAASGVWNISIGAAGNLLSQAITRYYGL